MGLVQWGGGERGSSSEQVQFSEVGRKPAYSAVPFLSSLSPPTFLPEVLFGAVIYIYIYIYPSSLLFHVLWASEYCQGNSSQHEISGRKLQKGGEHILRRLFQRFWRNINIPPANRPSKQTPRGEVCTAKASAAPVCVLEAFLRVRFGKEVARFSTTGH